MTTLQETSRPADDTTLVALRMRQLMHHPNPLHAALLSFQLDPLERKQMGGQVLPFSRPLVQSVAFALNEQPHLYPDAPFTGASLQADDDRANVFLMMHNQFTAMARLCLDAYLGIFSRISGQARTFVNQVTAGPPPGPTQLDAEQRLNVLSPAILVMIAYHGAQKKTRNKRAQAKALETKAKDKP